MSINKSKPVCIIAARKGSKRLKNKNIINFFGKPIILYAIEKAINSGIFEKIIVSSDSKKILKISKINNLIIPFLRKKKLSDDKTILKDVIKNCVNELKIKSKYSFFIYPTAALINISDLKKAFYKIKKMKYDLLIAIKESEVFLDKVFSIKNKNLIMTNLKKYQKFKSINKIYLDAGSFFIFNTKKYAESSNLSLKTTFYLLDKNDAVDVNVINDLKIMKTIYRTKKNFYEKKSKFI
jgi:pseudaminic acid cytidylyltransferase